MFTESMIPFWTAVGSIAAALAVVVGVLTWLKPGLGRGTRKRVKLAVRRVVDPSDEDLPAAYDVYCSGITNESERDSFSEIQRWLSEAQEARSSGKATLDEYLLIAKAGAKVCGFFYGQYYPSHRMFLIGYLVIDRTSPDARRATSIEIVKFMADLLRADHPDCAGVVFELALDPEKNSRARTGKETLFSVHARTAAGLVFKRLDVVYQQPKLSLWDPSLTEERQHLVYGRVSRPPLTSHIEKIEAAHVLDAVYNCWYGDYYLDDPVRDLEYRRYVRAMYETAVSGLPEQVPLL